MGSICLIKQKNLASISQSDTEVAEEQAISDQMNILSCNFIQTLELQFKSTIQSNQSEQANKLTSELSQTSQQTIKKGILKNKNTLYQQELRLLRKVNEDDINYEQLRSYLRARKQQQGSYEIHL
ncbi:unnamed protein product [Paramecium sonneborni]|uniref:Uncharacterized protein n=1 Tax=Paramecium sonneborni TaxID=65129 RepID=A0A8S1RD58_9CILI|nr:unnamed protein product [Paramecium sonneborni]